MHFSIAHFFKLFLEVDHFTRKFNLSSNDGGFIMILFNDRNSISRQLAVSFSFIILIVSGITLGICYGVLYATGDQAYMSAKQGIRTATDSNILTSAREIAGEINQELASIAQSICMVSAKYSSVLMNYATINSTTLAPQKSYREYKFGNSSCAANACPPDYGSLRGRTRTRWIPGFQYGSMQHSSVYLYSSEKDSALRTDESWNAAVNKYPNIERVINALAYQDRDMNVMYTAGPYSTVFFYLSAQLTNSYYPGDGYFAIHRTYPGLERNDLSYNPPARPWFQNAPEDDYYMDGPYQETFTKQLVINLSSRKTSTAISGQRLALVSAAVMLLEDLRSLVDKIKFPNSGHAALLKYGTYEVLYWKNNYETFDPSTQSFRTIAEVEPSLTGYDFSAETTFSYTDGSGVSWRAASVPLFLTRSDGAFSSKYALVLVVFARQDEAESPLASLRSSIDATYNRATIPTAIIIALVVGIVSFLLSVLFFFVVKPLQKMIEISTTIVQMAAEDDDHKDYTAVIQDAFFSTSRLDEIGMLVRSYFNLLCMLHNNTEEKKKVPKYPANPFHIPAFSEYECTWDWNMYYNAVYPHLTQPSAPVPSKDVKATAGNGAEERDRFGMDVLSSISSVSPSDDVSKSSVTSHAPKPLLKVGICTSLRSMFLSLMMLYMLGISAVMIVTVVVLSGDGNMWMNKTGDKMETKQMQTLNLVASSKAVFVKVTLHSLKILKLIHFFHNPFYLAM